MNVSQIFGDDDEPVAFGYTSRRAALRVWGQTGGPLHGVLTGCESGSRAAWLRNATVWPQGMFPWSSSLGSVPARPSYRRNPWSADMRGVSNLGWLCAQGGRSPGALLSSKAAEEQPCVNARPTVNPQSTLAFGGIATISH
jgi:hypothetical protein